MKRTIHVKECFENFGMALADLGFKDAQSGRPPYSPEVFENLTRELIKEEASETKDVLQEHAELMQDNYMIGYNGSCQEVAG